ncbi:hypothetical protein [Desulforamulus putei]|uniref:PASTA domain-containing protein n=1 Tax=Desulforamulus putei DSM 12395 TaxID=1121429 RepID=A0A1M4ZZ18_9FIRM|nr:hypothetical protein [Desulforamulus putei]SHF22972.1 hypothetical protein SAMN02745133_02123 [Desulforamulus putei DSM 12395]
MIPDVLGYRLNDAVSLLKNSGYKVTVVITDPPGGSPGGPERVVRLEAKGSDEVVLTVACEEKGKGGIHNGL